MAYCTNCAQEMSDLAAACPSCGHPTARVGTTTNAGGAGPSGPRADFGQRFIAWLIDFAMLFVLSFVLQTILKEAGSALSTLVGVGYFVYLEGGPSGQTVGKKVMNIRVIRMVDGGPLGYGSAFIRYLGRIVSSIPFGLGFFWMLWDPEKQTWHDKFASAVVVPTSDYPVDAWPG